MRSNLAHCQTCHLSAWTLRHPHQTSMPCKCQAQAIQSFTTSGSRLNELSNKLHCYDELFPPFPVLATCTTTFPEQFVPSYPAAFHNSAYASILALFLHFSIPRHLTWRKRGQRHACWTAKFELTCGKSSSRSCICEPKPTAKAR